MIEKDLFLKYEFGQEELLGISRELARENADRDALENQKKAVTSELKSKIDLATAHIGSLSLLINNGYEMRNVKCVVDYNNPKEGLKSVQRTDTGETWIEKMSREEVEQLPM